MPFPAVRMLAAAALATVPLAGQSTHPTFWRYAYPGSKAYVGINIDGISKSALGHRLKRLADENGIRQVAANQGMDFVFNIDSVFISTPGREARQPKPSVKTNPPAVIAIQGRFDLTAVRTLAGAKASRTVYRGVEILRKPSDSMSVALVSPQVLLLGDRADLHAAIEHHKSTDPRAWGNPLFNRATELSAIYDIWFAAEAPPSSLAGGGLPGASQMLSDVESLEGGISFREGLGAEFSLMARTPEAAQALASGIQAMMSLAAVSGQQDNPDLAQLLKKLEVRTQTREVNLSLRFTPQEVETALNSALDSARSTLASAGLTPAFAGAGAGLANERPAARPVRSRAHEPVAETPPEPAQPFVVRILNAEGGTHEVPLTRPQ